MLEILRKWFGKLFGKKRGMVYERTATQKVEGDGLNSHHLHQCPEKTRLELAEERA